jgi:general secretion pathway protein E
MNFRIWAFNVVATAKKPLGEILQQQNKLAPKDLDAALQFQALQQEKSQESEKLGSILTHRGLVSERDVAIALAEQMSLPLINPEDYPVDPLFDNDQVSVKFMKTVRVAPVSLDGSMLTLAMADPRDDETMHAMSLAGDCEVSPVVGLASELEQALEGWYGDGKSRMGQLLDEFDDDGDGDFSDQDVAHLKDIANEAPLIKLVNLLLQRAITARASDIHIEPFEQQLKVRYRVDGVLRDVESPPAKSQSAVVSRIKILAKLDIAERRLPQDGRIKLRFDGQSYDIRVSTLPTMHGESVVMRILDNASISLDFSQMGFDEDILTPFLQAIDQPHGVVLVTGPTGSGKTTSLYTALQRLNTGGRKIMTVEDPVEYQLNGVNQIQVQPKIGLSFANALRSILRQDPDVIMIGEMRDLETASIAVQAALTGHLVISTLHTNDAPGSIARLLDMGVEDYLLTSAINAILAQRLLRRLCSQCHSVYEAPLGLIKQLGLQRLSQDDPLLLYRAQGCESCDYTGYQGRVAIHQMLTMNDAVSSAVVGKLSQEKLVAAAAEQGMNTLQFDGLKKALAGITTIEEVLRVTQDCS